MGIGRCFASTERLAYRQEGGIIFDDELRVIVRFEPCSPDCTHELEDDEHRTRYCIVIHYFA